MQTFHRRIAERIAWYLEAERSPATRRAYRSAWAAWLYHCKRHRVSPTEPAPADVCAWLVELVEKRRATTVANYAAAVSTLLQDEGRPSIFDWPDVRRLLKGIRRRHRAERPVHVMAPITDELLRQVVDACPTNRAGARDRALLLIGFGAALRRSELAALLVEDVKAAPAGVLVHVRRSKTDQAGRGVVVPVPDLPGLEVRAALEVWLEVAGLGAGAPLFVGFRGSRAGGRLRPESIHTLVKTAVERAGLPAGSYGAHSLRAGLVTTLAAAGVHDEEIRRLSRHRSRDVLRGYIRPTADPFVDHPLSRVKGGAR